MQIGIKFLSACIDSWGEFDARPKTRNKFVIEMQTNSKRIPQLSEGAERQLQSSDNERDQPKKGGGNGGGSLLIRPHPPLAHRTAVWLPHHFINYLLCLLYSLTSHHRAEF